MEILQFVQNCSRRSGTQSHQNNEKPGRACHLNNRSKAQAWHWLFPPPSSPQWPWPWHSPHWTWSLTGGHTHTHRCTVEFWARLQRKQSSGGMLHIRPVRPLIILFARNRLFWMREEIIMRSFVVCRPLTVAQIDRQTEKETDRQRSQRAARAVILQYELVVVSVFLLEILQNFCNRCQGQARARWLHYRQSEACGMQLKYSE